jgi:hypothetical protein
MENDKIELNGKIVTLENITLEDIEQLFDFDKTIMLQHRLNLGKEYLDTHFPENEKLFKKVQRSIKRNIKLTDPKTFKDTKEPLTYNKLLTVDYINDNERPKKKLKLQNRNKKTASRFFKKPKKKTSMQIMDQKISDLNKDFEKLESFFEKS